MCLYFCIFKWEMTHKIRKQTQHLFQNDAFAKIKNKCNIAKTNLISK